MLLSGIMQRAERNLLRLYYLLTQRTRHNRLVIEQVNGLQLVILPEVMNPRVFRTGAYFAEVLEKYPLKAHHHLLDMGCGSGVMALTAARRAQKVVAVDINPIAARCTRINALLNHLEQRVEVRQGDLFAPVVDAQFDLVLFNPPFFHGQPQPGFDQAWRSEDTVERFGAQLCAHLRPGGAALVIFSSDGDATRFLGLFEAQGYAVETVASRRMLAETLTVYRLQAGDDDE